MAVKSLRKEKRQKVKKVKKSNRSSGSLMKTGGEGAEKALEIDTKYQISIGVGCMFASLWLVFLALYIQLKLGNSLGSKCTPEEPNAKLPVLKVTVPPERDLHQPTKIGEKDGMDIMKYTLTNKHKVAVEVISIGARVNKMITTDGDDIVLGFNSEPGDDITELFQHKFGAIDGPICDTDDNTLHQVNFKSRVDHASGAVEFETTHDDIEIIVRYTLNDANEINSEVTATVSSGEITVDFCSYMHFKMDGAENVDQYRVKINAPEYFTGASSKLAVDQSIYDFRAANKISSLISYIALGNSNLKRTSVYYDLEFDTQGLIEAAEASSEGSSSKVTLHTDQEVIGLTFIMDEAFSVTGKEVYSGRGSVSFLTRYAPIVARTGKKLAAGSQYKTVNMYQVS